MKCKIFSIAYLMIKSICSACIFAGLALAAYYFYAVWLLVWPYLTTTAYAGLK